MIVVGAKGHALEVFQCLKVDRGIDLAFYDDINTAVSLIFDEFLVYHSMDQAKSHMLNDSRYILGLGGSLLRQRMANKFNEIGGILSSVIAETAVVSKDSQYGAGVNIMHFAFVAPNVVIGKGTLINNGAAIHHDVEVGEYCEISPGVRLLGRCTVGNNVSIGAGAVILPNIYIGDNAIVGAGAVVTRNISPGSKVIGIPAREILK